MALFNPNRDQVRLFKHGNESDAQHDLMDCLAETIWQAQRSGHPLDVVAYSARIEAKTN